MTGRRRATIVLLPEGGRDAPFRTSHAVLLLAPDCENARSIRTSCDLRAVDERILILGEEIDVEAHLINDEEFGPLAVSGETFRLFEGARLVGRGRWI